MDINTVKYIPIGILEIDKARLPSLCNSRYISYSSIIYKFNVSDDSDQEY